MGIIRAYKCFIVLSLLATFLCYANVPNRSSLILEKSSTAHLVIKQHPFLITVSAISTVRIDKPIKHSFLKKFSQDKIFVVSASKPIIYNFYRYLSLRSSYLSDTAILSHICKLQI